ncbi:hypothetical protein D9615_004493 [Tricholomella constricta]|uniref:Mei2-like C-terminal RNA recognition motif domain-containing protein n=1 Tax=Tricholomella constricta TaxID=117010 RepID=A0A8H5HC08_9AGAR|nr:hypothetical protein D9615_004493 [Tricholomella constricta]
MPSTNSQSRSSVDLGVRESPLLKTKAARNHPPRLQHSPSLPNIWFPPHSGPIPPQFEVISRAPLQRPSTPPFAEANGEPKQPPSPAKPPPSRKFSDHRESLSFDDLSEYLHETKPLKIQRRRRLDREQGYGHSLLTPPLTPSSSLRTTTSVDSTGITDSNSDSIRDVHSDEAEYQSTRFLLLSNISRQIRHDVLRASIVGSLTSRVDASNTSNNLSVPASGVHNGPLSEDSIKGVFLRCQQSNGIAMLAFFDVRHAEIAKQIISTPTDGPLSHCVGDDVGEDGRRIWITCQFITAEKLAEVIGNSPFLASTDGSFYLAVEGRGMAAYDGQELRVVDDRSNIDDGNLTENRADESCEETSVVDGEFSLSTLKSFLKSFGGLRSFSLAKDKLDVKQPPAKIFHVEYYDVRAAISAYTSIDGQNLFGMKVSVFGREDLSDAANAHPSHVQTTTSGSDPAKNHIPFPTSSGGHQNEIAPQFGPPGQYSLTRERFCYVEDAQSRPRSVSAGQDVYVNPISRSPVPSPTYFYTSNPVDGGTAVTASHDNTDRAGSDDPVYNAPDESYIAPGHLSQDRGNTLVFDGVNDRREWHREAGGHHNLTPGPYGSHHDCYYCPSRGSPSSATPDCYVPCTTPSPYCYQPNQHLQPLQNVPFPPVGPPAHAYGYEYDNSYPQSMSPTMAMNMAHLAFEHALMGIPRPVIGDHWFPETPGVVHPVSHVPYGAPQLPIPGGQNMHYTPSNKLDAQLAVDPAAEPFHNIFRSTPPAASPHPSRAAHTTPLQGSSANPREQRATTEHNQLNLNRIEDGQDTRTTVMIKNIPNKMSDKDLIAFIAKVCPRKIDFMYLRMDFQNGCNVGYAFVNFITVEDLLVFAKRKLGERWNMFSSEKVLQMSYANYQGKEALVEKFKNSCIMDEQEAWRPKIFYSEPGPEQGLPEPFPAPTHIRRKERSAYNRGALFVPGVGRGTATPQSIAHSRRLEDTRRSADRQGQNCGQATPGSYPLVGTTRRRTNAKLWGGSQLG